MAKDNRVELSNSLTLLCESTVHVMFDRFLANLPRYMSSLVSSNLSLLKATNTAYSVCWGSDTD